MEYADQYRQISPKSLRQAARGLAVSALAVESGVTGKSAAALRRPRVHFLYLHHVFADEEQGFSRFIQRLQRGHQIISHSDAVRRIKSGAIDRPYVSIGLDDGIKSGLRAAKILEDCGVTGCFFVCPGIVGEKDENKVARFCRERLALPLVEFMSWEQLERLRRAGHEIGSQTTSHLSLAALSGQQLSDEVAGSREILQRRLGEARHFAWPYGTFAHFSPEARKAVFAAGYESCASGVRGCHVTKHTGGLDELCIRRDHVIAGWPLSHTTYFMARSSRRASAEENKWPPELQT